MQNAELNYIKNSELLLRLCRTLAQVTSWAFFVFSFEHTVNVGSPAVFCCLFFFFLPANFPSFNQTRLCLVCHSVPLLLRDRSALLSRALMMLAAVVFIRPSRYAYGNMACLISAAGSEAADTPTASLRVRLPQSPCMGRKLWLPSLLRLFRLHQKKK